MACYVHPFMKNSDDFDTNLKEAVKNDVKPASQFVVAGPNVETSATYFWGHRDRFDLLVELADVMFGLIGPRL